MDRSLRQPLSRILTTLAVIALAAGAASGDAIPGYTVTNLGAGLAAVTTDSQGNGILLAPDHQTYSFPRTDNAVANPQSLLASLPPLTNAPWGYTWSISGPEIVNGYSYFENQGVFLNQNGVFAGTDLTGISFHTMAAGSTALASQRLANGSFGPFVGMWGSVNNLETGGQLAQVLDLNNLNQALGISAQGEPGNSTLELVLYNFNTNKAFYFDQVLSGWKFQNVYFDTAALDDKGQIFLTATKVGGNGTIYSLLLTPTDPITVPEPTTLATLVAGLGGLALRYRRRNNPGPGPRVSPSA